MEQLPPRVLEMAQAVQRREAVDRDEVEAVHPHALIDVLAQDVEPVLRELFVLVLEPDPADVEHVELHVLEARHPEIRQGGLHRTRGAGDEDERASWDASAERLVETLDVCLETVHGRTLERAGWRYKGVMGKLSWLKGGRGRRIHWPSRKVHQLVGLTSKQR